MKYYNLPSNIDFSHDFAFPLKDFPFPRLGSPRGRPLRRIQVAARGHVILCFLLLFNCTVKCQPNFNLRFLTSDHSMAPVRFNWIVFARKMHSTSEFAKMFLSKCVYHLNRCKTSLFFFLLSSPFLIPERACEGFFVKKQPL